MTRDAEDKPADVASAESTGGAGTNFEARVAAIVLARMLLGDRVAGLDFPIERVLLQSRFAEHLIDDITIFGTDHYGAERVIDYQSKRSIDPIPSDEEFEETIRRCLQTIGAARPTRQSGRRQRTATTVVHVSIVSPLVNDVCHIAANDTVFGGRRSLLRAGQATARVGLGSRHAQLAVNAALIWCQLMLDTLADPETPWRKGHS